jgi:hypothetical protein
VRTAARNTPDVCKPIDTSLLDMGGSGSTRSEDIALARSQRLDVDDDNEPAPENIPAVGTAIDSMDKSGDGMVLVIKIRTSRGCEPSNQRLYQE